MIRISDKCVGCSKCAGVCPFGAITVADKKVSISSACTLCGTCIQVCPVKALSIVEEEKINRDISAHKGVWVYIELFESAASAAKKIKQVSLELLCEGRKLADKLGEDLCAVILTDKNNNYEAEAASYGADKVYLVENEELFEYNTDIFSTVIISLINKYKPSSMLYGATIQGRDLAPRIAAAIHVGLTADCTALSIKDGLLLQSRPAFGGNIMADILSPDSRPQMATVRPNVMRITAPVQGRKAAVIRENMRISKTMRRVQVLERKVERENAGDRIENAKIIISGGRGMKTKEKFAQLEQIAKPLGGVIGASRAAVDLGFKDKSHQVGQSGTTVSPRLYMSFGISGAVQHIVGMKSSDVIIAINKDPDAPIFNVAKYGIVGDVHETAAKLAEKLKKK